MTLLTFLFKHSWKLIVLSTLAGAVSGLCNVGLIAMINKSLSSPQSAGNLVWLFAGTALAVVILRALTSVLWTYLAQNAIFDLRLQLSSQILKAPLKDMEEIGIHRLMATLGGDAAAITGGLMSIPAICMQLALLIGSVAYLAWLSWTIFFGVLVFIVLGTISYQAAKVFARVRELGDDLYSHFRALTEGAKELKMHQRRRNEFITGALQPTLSDLQRTQIRGNNIYMLAGSWGQLLFFTLMGLLIFGLPQIRTISSETLIGYAFTVLFIIGPLESLMSTIPSLNNASVILDRVEQLGLTLSTGRVEELQSESIEVSSDWTQLSLVEVTHTYNREGESSKFTLGPLNLNIYPGETIFVIGGNGSGKTTLAKVLIGLYAPESGEIRLNGQAINETNREYYRQYFSVVHANFYLFKELFGLEKTNLDEEAGAYLGRLQLDHKVKITNGKLSTIDLSQGQRKRLALLTAYLEDRPIYLFDEWAAEQDPYFKELFYLELLPELKARGKTLVVITHDDRYFHLADRIIKLDEGRLFTNQKFDSDVSEIAPAIRI
jgi:putative pyoverdin transport system ATP-binding/permease protein